MNAIAKTIEINSSSSLGLEDAIQGGLTKVSRTIENIRGAWVSDIKVRTSPDGRITEWRTCLRVTFVVE
ncbi:flavin-binding protein dodecin [Luteibacter jiangsuensis]|uniref:Flavin-binding protein dodecin n=1 Tax=Luteibacter jiangsuensis TaxID=637577 RepID=A0ABT9SW36_9GAMM|nr:dodecin family protein [Luteibacter jiangsuensis]MDQ0008197.1 flavin-binding protein dodecin [Luteibacter jiangsuensis]